MMLPTLAGNLLQGVMAHNPEVCTGYCKAPSLTVLLILAPSLPYSPYLACCRVRGKLQANYRFRVPKASVNARPVSAMILQRGTPLVPLNVAWTQGNNSWRLDQAEASLETDVLPSGTRMLPIAHSMVSSPDQYSVRVTLANRHQLCGTFARPQGFMVGFW